MVIVVALVGLAGVIVGGILSGLVTLHIERLRDGRAALIAGRLISDDLEYLRSYVRVGNERQQVVPLETLASLSMDAWREQRGLLAGNLSYAEWDALAIAARQADRYIKFVTKVSEETDGSGRELLVREQDDLKAVESDIAQGVESLRPLADASRLPRTWVPGFSWPVK